MSERPTIRDVAARAGVSIATVSRVMNEKGEVGPETRTKVLAAAAALRYGPDAAARALVSHRTMRVGLVVGDNSGHRDLSLVFFGKVLAEISRRLTDSGYDKLSEAADFHLEGVRRAFAAHFTDDELETLAGLLARLDGSGEKGTCSPPD